MVGIRPRQRGCRNLPHAILVAHVTRVGEAVAVGASRTDEHTDGTTPCSFSSTARALAHGRSIARSIAGPLHAVIDVDDLAREGADRCLEPSAQRAMWCA